jgi:hypothetical protein
MNTCSLTNVELTGHEACAIRLSISSQSTPVQLFALVTPLLPPSPPTSTVHLPLESLISPALHTGTQLPLTSSVPAPQFVFAPAILLLVTNVFAVLAGTHGPMTIPVFKFSHHQSYRI